MTFPATLGYLPPLCHVDISKFNSKLKSQYRNLELPVLGSHSVFAGMMAVSLQTQLCARAGHAAAPAPRRCPLSAAAFPAPKESHPHLQKKQSGLLKLVTAVVWLVQHGAQAM